MEDVPKRRGRPPKIRPDGPEPVPNLKPNDDYPLGKVYVSENGHEATVVAVDDTEVTFAFTRVVKDDEELRQRSVLRKNVKFFLKAYT